MIAVDAMGGDHAPGQVLHGAVGAAKSGIPILLCGDQEILIPALNQICDSWQSMGITIEHCSQVVSMSEEPTRAVIRKKDSSLVRAMHAVAEGRAHAVVSAGNSGAVLVASSLIIGRLAGVLRPAVACFLPTHVGSVLCLDVGGNVDSKPAFLEQFAHMGFAYSKIIQGIERPRVALLSNGHEAYKGSHLVRDTYALLEKSADVHFVGNIEARDIFDHRADVIVCDGFAGNVLLKAMQGTVKAFSSFIKHEARSSWWYMLLMALSAGLFKKIRKKTDYQAAGGALLLGVKQTVVLAHGCSHALAIENAIRRAYDAVKHKHVALFAQQLNSSVFKREIELRVAGATSPSFMQYQ